MKVCARCWVAPRIARSRNCDRCHGELIRERTRIQTYVRALKAEWGEQPCFRCGVRADTADHIIPLTSGGATVPGNLRPACRDCNTRRNAYEDLTPFVDTQLRLLAL